MEELSKRLSGNDFGRPQFEDKSYAAKEFSLANLTQLEKSGHTVCFVDGGSMVLLHGPDFALAAHRVYYCKYKGLERAKPVLPNSKGFFSLTYAAPKDGKMKFETTLFTDDERAKDVMPDKADLTFDSFDHTITNGIMRADASSVAMIAREFAEWKIIETIAKGEDAEIIVRDGTLQTVKTNESRYARSAIAECAKRGMTLCAVSKTSSLLTTTGMSLTAAITKLANGSEFKDSSWYYSNIVDISHPDHEAEMFVAKFHQSSEHAFRVEILKRQAQQENVKSVLEGLAANALDLAFPGYPYGLINAHVMARLSNEETKYEKFRAFKAMDGEELLSVRAMDAHQLLDAL